MNRRGWMIGGAAACAVAFSGYGDSGAPVIHTEHVRVVQTLEIPAVNGTPAMTLLGYGFNIASGGKVVDCDESVKWILQVCVEVDGYIVQVIRGVAIIEVYDGVPFHGIELQDVDFDGHPDLLFHEGCGAQNHSLAIWRFLPDERKFKFDPVFSSHIGGSLIEYLPEEKAIFCAWHIPGETEAQLLASGKEPSGGSLVYVRDGKLIDRDGKELTSYLPAADDPPPADE